MWVKFEHLGWAKEWNFTILRLQIFISSNCCWLILIVHVLSVQYDWNNLSNLNVCITKVTPCKIPRDSSCFLFCYENISRYGIRFSLVCTRAATDLYSERIESNEISCHPFPPTHILIPSFHMDLNIQNGIQFVRPKLCSRRYLSRFPWRPHAPPSFGYFCWLPCYCLARNWKLKQ